MLGLQITMSMKKHLDFAQWAFAQGVEINGIEAHRFPHRGIGIIAKQRVKAGSVLLTVPCDILRTVDTIPRFVMKAIKNGSVHGKLALSQCLDTTGSQDPWRAVMPSLSDFRESMPFLWTNSLQELLSPAAKGLLENQQRKYTRDWALAIEAFPTLNEEDYLYHWLLVNTRTFYWVAPGTKKPPHRDECLALVPFADYFNHADTGCKVEIGPDCLTVTADRMYEKGVEVYISYGSHSNDFLLAEYGFISEENIWDELQLDHLILPELSAKKKMLLEEERFLGNYVLDRNTVCYRTQVSLMLLCRTQRKWRLIVSGDEDGEIDRDKVNEILVRLLRRYLKNANESILKITSISEGMKSQREMLARRWEQIIGLVSTTITRIENT